MFSFIITLINYASYTFLLIIFFWITCLLVNTPPKATPTTKREKQLGPQVRSVAGSEATPARLVPVAPLTFRGFGVAPPRRNTELTPVVSDDADLSACFDSLSVTEYTPEIATSMPIPEVLECFTSLSMREPTPEVATKSLGPISRFDNLSIKEISPCIARSIRPAISCQKTTPSSSSSSSIETISAGFEKISVKEHSAPRRPRSKTPLRRSTRKASMSIDDFEMSPRPQESFAVDFFTSNKDVIMEGTLRSCLKGSNVSSAAKKSVSFTTLVSMYSVVKSEVRFYKPTLRKGKKFQCFSEEQRVAAYLSSSHYPHEFGRTSIVEEEGGKYFLLKELGTFYSPEKPVQSPKKPARVFESFT